MTETLLSDVTNRKRAQRALTVLGAVGLVAVSGLVSGCGLSTVTSGLSGSMFGSKQKPEAVAAVTEQQLLSAAKAEYGEGSINVGSIAHGCPKFAIMPAGNAYTVYEPGQEGDALAVKHRGEITRVARECSIGQGQVTVKYGFSGRVLLGPRGQSGQVSLPVAVAVTDLQRARLAEQDVAVTVDVSTAQPIGYFSIVRDVTVPVPQGARAGDLSVSVGFKQPAPALGSPTSASTDRF